MDHWDLPVRTVDGTVYDECPQCESSGPHECVEVSGVLIIECRHCGNEYGWGARHPDDARTQSLRRHHPSLAAELLPDPGGDRA
jgi:ribosomal protein L37AE/L43A